MIWLGIMIGYFLSMVVMIALVMFNDDFRDFLAATMTRSEERKILRRVRKISNMSDNELITFLSPKEK